MIYIYLISCLLNLAIAIGYIHYNNEHFKDNFNNNIGLIAISAFIFIPVLNTILFILGLYQMLKK